MLDGTRRWLRRNRNGIAIGFGAIGAAYLAGQYVLNKISDARERMALDRRAKEEYVEHTHMWIRISPLYASEY